MRIDLTAADRVLMDRYFESVLLRFRDDKYNLLETTQELALAFTQMANGEPAFRDHMLGVVEAGDDA